MSVNFNPKNNIIRLCMMAMAMEDANKPEEANTLLNKAWNEAKNEFERFIAAYHLGRHEKYVADKLKWMDTSLEEALKIDDISVKSALPTLYTIIAKLYEDLGNNDKAQVNYDLSNSFTGRPTDKGPFYHGTKADLNVGELLIPGHNSNYKSDLKMNHIYFSANLNGAGLAAGLAKGEGKERVYIIEPTGSFENDPNVTDKKFPGNLTRSYRSSEALKIVGEIEDWNKQTPEEISKWKEKLANNKGEIIN